MASSLWYWVSWKDESNETDARNSAIIWGPQASAPAQLAGFFLSGRLSTKADAVAYKNAIGTNSIVPPPGTPLLGGQQVPNPLAGVAQIGDFFGTLTQAATWERAGIIVLGLILFAVGVARVTGAQNVISEAVKAAPVLA